MLLRFEVDMCMGAGYCAKRSPRFFRITSDGFAALNGVSEGGDAIQISESDTDEARECVYLCPAGAIDVTTT